MLSRVIICAVVSSVVASVSPVVHAWRGSTPTLDGVLDPGEWADADGVDGAAEWLSEFEPVSRGVPVDVNASFYVKHDGAALYFAIVVTDDVILGADVPRWLPSGNPDADSLTQFGWPWFGDEAELLINARGTWANPNDTAVGNGTSWQMVVNTGKSRLGGMGVGGLLEGEPRSSDDAWATYGAWIRSGAMRAGVRVSLHTAAGRGSTWVAEWGIAFNPCLEVRPGHFYTPDAFPDGLAVGLNVAIGDTDAPAASGGNPYGLRHEQWWSGKREGRTRLSEFGTLLLEPRGRPGSGGPARDRQPHE